jgi:hypothetical protein
MFTGRREGPAVLENDTAPLLIVVAPNTHQKYAFTIDRRKCFFVIARNIMDCFFYRSIEGSYHRVSGNSLRSVDERCDGIVQYSS